MGTNYYKVCKCCGHEKTHLGKISFLGKDKGTVFSSNFENIKTVLEVAKALKKNEEIRGGGEKLTFEKFREEVLECASFKKIEGEFS